jgi:hypothetical protein
MGLIVGETESSFVALFDCKMPDLLDSILTIFFFGDTHSGSLYPCFDWGDLDEVSSDTFVAMLLFGRLKLIVGTIGFAFSDFTYFKSLS